VPTAVTVGTFDGVHLGHQQLLAQLVRTAKANALRPTVITFDTHPQELVKSKKPDIQILTDLDEKIALFQKLGIVRLVVLRFDQELAQLSPRAFVQEVLAKRLKAKWVIIGYDHAFGKNRGGDRESIRSISQEMGFQIREIGPVIHNGIAISSTKIRQALYRGDVLFANSCLGRHYAISGVVVPGDGRGRNLGFPTANLHPNHPKKLLPADGVYAGRARVNLKDFLAAISIGSRPTFHGGARILEAYLIDFDGDLYGKEIQLSFQRHIRDQLEFGSAEQLVSQLNADINLIKEMSEILIQTQ
jgi:riboflavin kinase/FMN adenylyltransferase